MRSIVPQPQQPDRQFPCVSKVVLLSLNPAISDEQTGAIDQALDLYAPANGCATYSPAFTAAFQAGVAARMKRLVAFAQGRSQIIAAGKSLFNDDEPMTHSYYQGALKTTVNRFLTTFAVRVTHDFSYGEDDLTGIDWSSSISAPIGSATGIHVPLLTIGMTGHWEYLAAEKIYLAAASQDKSIAFVVGASHGITACKECEKTPSQYQGRLRLCRSVASRFLP